MPSVTVAYRDGTTQRFEERGRAGGSWVQTVRYAEGVVIIVDEWGKETAIPLDLVREVTVDAARGGW